MPRIKVTCSYRIHSEGNAEDFGMVYHKDTGISEIVLKLPAFFTWLLYVYFLQKQFKKYSIFMK